jgi:hypothetical protein
MHQSKIRNQKGLGPLAYLGLVSIVTIGLTSMIGFGTMCGIVSSPSAHSSLDRIDRGRATAKDWQNVQNATREMAFKFEVASKGAEMIGSDGPIPNVPDLIKSQLIDDMAVAATEPAPTKDNPDPEGIVSDQIPKQNNVESDKLPSYENNNQEQIVSLEQPIPINTSRLPMEGDITNSEWKVIVNWGPHICKVKGRCLVEDYIGNVQYHAKILHGKPGNQMQIRVVRITPYRSPKTKPQIATYSGAYNGKSFKLQLDHDLKQGKWLVSGTMVGNWNKVQGYLKAVGVKGNRSFPFQAIKQ